MKKLSFLFLLTLFLAINYSFAQDDDRQMFSVYEYEVKPDMVAQSEKFDKKLIALLDEHNCSGPNWITAQSMDNRFLYIEPISSMADLDKKDFKELADKMGKDALKEFWKTSYAYEASHKSYVLSLDKSLSYMPEGIDITTPGEDFRRWDYFHLKADKYNEAEELATKIQKLFVEKKSKVAYRFYRSGFGTKGPFFMVASSAKNMADHSQKLMANREVMGPEFLDLYQQLMACCKKVDFVYGQMRPDLSRNAKAIAKVD